MRSLSLKLTLAFLFVGIIGILLVAIFVRQQTAREFDRFVLNRSQVDLVETLTEYYAENGRWAGVDAILLRGGNNRPGPGTRAARPILLDADRIVVFGGGQHRAGERLPPRENKQAIPLELNGDVVGWLLYDTFSARGRPQLAPPELNFLQNVNKATFWGAVGAVAVALLLGVVLARTISRPVQELTEATRIVAQGDLGHQVPVRTQDELGKLADSFNRMSADLAQANRLRRQMTADIAHDLRTPLSVIMGYTEALDDGKLQGSPEMYGIMHKQALALSHLIEDLRTLSLADAGELSLTRRPISPRTLLEQTAAAYTAQAQRHNIALGVNADPNLPALDVDPDRMAQVLGNLVSNALRYTPDGGDIVLSAVSEADGLHLCVRDNGSGIAPADLPYIFSRFYRGDKARPDDGESGLGLAIARSIVEAHGGTITAESTLGQGTLFTIVMRDA